MSSKSEIGSLRPSFRDLVRNWWPVAVWLVVLRLESSDFASSPNTLGLLSRIASSFFEHVDPQILLTFNAVIRKSGHFIGYAILSLLVFRALKYTRHDQLRLMLQRRWGSFFRDLWQFNWAVTAVLFTIVAASLDELHQAFIPSRTGRWQDVALDTAGAIAMQLLLYAGAWHAMSLQRKRAENHQK